MMRLRLALFIFVCTNLLFACKTKEDAAPLDVRGWTLLSDSYEDALVTIKAAGNYNINHLQLSHHIIMDLCEVRDPKKQKLVNDLTRIAHKSGIKEVVAWDHSFYDLDYYPDEYKTGPDSTLDLDNPEFWAWFKDDYRKMFKLIPEIDGLVLTFIETGARAERQFSEKWKSGPEKLAAVVDAVADVVCNELNKKLYIRTFAYTDEEYENTVGALNFVKSKDVILMMKETPHDFFLTHPNDKFAGTINRPTIIEYDTGNEFNGQGIIANTWPEYVMGRMKDFLSRPNIVGYVARTDRYGNTRIVGTPNEILLYALKRTQAEPSVSSDLVYEEFITEHYGQAAVPFLKPAFSLAFDIVTSSLYTLGTNIANHSALNYGPYKSSYGRHVSGKWINPPVVEIKHDVNKSFHYWKNVIEHLAPAELKRADGPLKKEAPYVIDSAWVTDKELMNEEYLTYVIREKQYSVKQAEKAVTYIEQAKSVLTPEAFSQLHDLFTRTLLTTQLHCAVAAAYFGHRIYLRGSEFRSENLRTILDANLRQMLEVAEKIEKFEGPTPVGQWNWQQDAKAARDYHSRITEALKSN